MQQQNSRTDRPLVSVVTIFLNGEPFLEEAIASVYAQTYPNWELLLVDDGSTDGSPAIARRHAQQRPGQVRYLEHPGHENRGMSAARNLGLEQARGEFIAFLDADDVWLPQKLEKQVAALQAHPQVAMVYGPTLDWYGWTGKPEDARRDARQDLGVNPGAPIAPPRLLPVLLRSTDHSPRTCSVLVRREAVRRVGGFEPVFRGLYEDQVFFSKLCLQETVLPLAECLDRYRKHPAACCLTAQRDGEWEAARKRFLDWLAGYLASRGVRDAELNRALAREQWPFRHPRLHRVARGLRRARGGARKAALAVARALLPATLRRKVSARWRGREYCPPVGQVRWGDLRRTIPISPDFGFDRGRPVDRYYVEQFLAAHAGDIRGRVLEVGDDTYTRRFGGNAVRRVDVLNVTAGAPGTTIVADLTQDGSLGSERFDCIVLTQTLQFLYDLPTAVRTLHRALRPGGVLLATCSGISPLGRDQWRGSWYWHLTDVSAGRLFGEVFGEGNVQVETFGNVLAAVAFLHGLAAEELEPSELEARGDSHPLLIGVRAVKRETEERKIAT